jgi:ketosteroid isomerase-like protein
LAEDDADTLRRAYEALNRGDIDGTLAPLRPDAEWRESPEMPGWGRTETKKSK